MPNSKLNTSLEFNEKKWVVSLVNTTYGVKGLYGGHAKIIVEGITKKDPITQFGRELFIAEYHIMEANRIPSENWIPQCFRNTKCNYLVILKEENNYNDRQDVQYSEVSSKSWHVTPASVRKMIENIKQEKESIENSQKEADFQYAGNWCFYSYKGGHNCTTWAEEKLAIAGIGNNFIITDSSKAVPQVHVSCSLL